MKLVTIILLCVALNVDCYRKPHQLSKRADNDTAEIVDVGEIDEPVLGISDTENRDDNSDHREEHGENARSMPKFVSKMVLHSPTSITLELQPSGIFGSSIHSCEIIVIKLVKDANGLPHLTKQNTDIFTSFGPYHGRNLEQDPYIAARYATALFPDKITIGDNRHYGGFLNGALEPSSYYAIFLRGVSKTGSQTFHIVSDYISDLKNPNIPAYYATDEPSGDNLFLSIIVSLGGLTMMAIVISLHFVMKQRKGNDPEYTRLTNEPQQEPERGMKELRRKEREMKRQNIEKGGKPEPKKTVEDIALKSAKQIKRLGDLESPSVRGELDDKMKEKLSGSGDTELEQLKARMAAYRLGVGRKIRGEVDKSSNYAFVLEGDANENNGTKREEVVRKANEKLAKKARK